MILYKTKQKISNNAEKANQNMRKKQKVLEENEKKRLILRKEGQK